MRGQTPGWQQSGEWKESPGLLFVKAENSRGKSVLNDFVAGA